jgi:uncharacterized protein YndB with AHSA1/START domain
MIPIQRDTFELTLPSDREILLTRKFSAGRKLVYEVMSRPEHIAQWWGPRSMRLTVCDMDFRVGGSYRFVLRGPDGNDYGFRGDYREIVEGQRVVSTFEFDGAPGCGSIETMTLTEHDGVTTVTVCCLYATKEHRDGHLNSGMESGARESHDRLEELIESLHVTSCG